MDVIVSRGRRGCRGRRVCPRIPRVRLLGRWSQRLRSCPWIGGGCGLAGFILLSWVVGELLAEIESHGEMASEDYVKSRVI